MKKLLALLLAVCLLCPVAFASQLSDAPQPKPEVTHAHPQPLPPGRHAEFLKFGAATVFFGGSAVFQVLAEHHGAQLCKIEALRQGIPWAGNSSSSGFRPDNADRREAYITGGIYTGALILELTGHKTAAKRILIFGGTANYGIGGATYWAGCN